MLGQMYIEASIVLVVVKHHLIAHAPQFEYRILPVLQFQILPPPPLHVWEKEGFFALHYTLSS